MNFLFFDAAGNRLFTRSDAESATWTVEEMSLQALFPYDAAKVIQRGMRIGFFDDINVYRAFEIRKVRTYEPDHYQEITAEHIVISELSDEHLDKTEITTKTAAQALTTILTGTLWSLGNNTASGTQTADIAKGSVWQGVRSIEENWNVYITPRLTWSTAGITGRFLDIKPAGSTWRGVRLSVDKNADEMGVTWDDTNVITAIYGYGAMVEDPDDDDKTIPLTFEDEVWTATSSHPAKPAGQKYLEDPDAKALYGRNGRNRFGYYQNSNIKSASRLLSKSWQVLKTTNHPQIEIDCQVRDLYRLGYDDQPLQLHDSAIIEVRPTGEQYQKEIIQMTVDLLDPTATRVTIGDYIPNIVYMKRQKDKKSGGGGGGGGRGGSGGGDGDGQDNEVYEFVTELQANQYQINLRAYQRDLAHTDQKLLLSYAALGITSDSITSIVTSSHVQLNDDGTIKTDADGNPIFTGNTTPGVWSQIKQNADRIALVVDGQGIKAASIVLAINDAGSSVTISADKIVLDGSTSVSSLLTGRSTISTASIATAHLGTTDINANGSLSIDKSSFSLDRKSASWQSKTVVTGVTITDTAVSTSDQRYFLGSSGLTSTTPTTVTYGRLVTASTNGSHNVTTETIYYLGRANA